MAPAWLATWLALAVLGAARAQRAPEGLDAGGGAPQETDATRAAAKLALDAIESARSSAASKDLAQARERLSSALDALLQTPGREASGEIADALERLGKEAAALNDPATVARAFEPCLAYRIATLGDEHIDVQVLRAALGTTYWSLGNLARSEELHARALDCAQRTLAPDDPRIADAKSNYAVTLFRLGRFEGARRLMAETVAGLVAKHGERDPEIQWAFANLANILDKLGDYEGALAMRERVFAILSERLAPDHADLLPAKENFALALRKAGDPVAARGLLQDVLDAKQRVLPAGHVALERTRQNLALVLCDLGDWHSARILLEGVVQRLAQKLPEGEPSLMSARSNLALALAGLGEHDAAVAIAEALLETCRREYGEDHQLTLEAEVDVANARGQLGEHARAVELGEAAVARLRARGPDDAFLLLRAEGQLSRSMARLGRNDEAIALLTGVAERWARRLGPDHHNVWRARVQLAGLVEDRDRERALAILRDVAQSLIARAAGARPMSSPREMELAALDLEPFVAAVLARCTGPEDAARCFAVVEATRQFAGAGIRSLGALERACAADPAVREQRDALRRKSAEVARLALAGSREAYQAAAIERASLEQALLAAVRRFGGAEAVDLTPAALAARLPDGAAAVSYRRFEVEETAAQEPDGIVNVARFVAFVVRRDASVRRVDLGGAPAIEDAIDAWRDAIAGGGASSDAERAAGETVRAAVLDPILAAAGDVRRLVVVPDDALLTVPMDALARAGGVVGDEIAIEVRTALFELLERRTSGAGARRLVAVGGVDFDTTPAPADASDAAADPARAERLPAPRSNVRMSPRATRFAPLPASDAEVAGVADLMRTRGDEALVLRGTGATADALAASVTQARFLHVATHGFFAPESVAYLRGASDSDAFSREVQGLSPHVLCGLALAGANAPENPLRRAGGLLTAEELAYLDLGACELATLSACDTSTGVRRAGQGLASLRSALHAAGAHTTLTSLWKVPDAATSELMLAFYRALWVDGADKATALWRAKGELRRRRAPLRDWAGWVLSGDPD